RPSGHIPRGDAMGSEHFGARLRELREAAGLTQQELASRAGVQWETISRWERGAREPSWSNVLALAGVLGVDCTTFNVPAGEPRPPPEPQPRGRPRKPDAEAPGQAESPRGKAAGGGKAAPKKGRKKT